MCSRVIATVEKIVVSKRRHRTIGIKRIPNHVKLRSKPTSETNTILITKLNTIRSSGPRYLVSSLVEISFGKSALIKL